ncbi:Microtubule-associated protein 1A [Orobanche gracilis]
MAGGSDALETPSLSCAKCGKPARLQCPKCVEFKLPREGAAFCSQDCFRASWSSHKSIHLKAKLSSPTPENPGEENLGLPNDGWLYCLRKGQSRTLKIPSFDWTGNIRPYPILKRRSVPAHIDLPDWAIDGIPKIEPDSDLQHVVEIKTPDQIARMRETCRDSKGVLDAAARVIRPGITTDEIDAVVHEATVAAGKLEDGGVVNVDVTVVSDLSETFFVGNVDEASKRLVQRTYECLEKAIAAGVWLSWFFFSFKPGVRFRVIGEIVNRHASVSGLSVVKSYCGHGVGELFHCAPSVPHYAIVLLSRDFTSPCGTLTEAGNKAVGVMKAGQTFTIEPMINSGVWRDRMWPGGWTAVTAGGKRSAQSEHTMLVTDTGVEVLTARLPSSPSVFPWLNL